MLSPPRSNPTPPTHTHTPPLVRAQWQTSNILAPNPDITVSVSAYAPFQPCIKNPVAGCNATQAAQWTGYAAQFTDALAAARAATPPAQAAANGGVITSCPIHTTLISGLSHRITVGGKSLYTRLAEWFLAPQGGDAFWAVDAPYPGDKSCPKPSEAAAAAALAGDMVM